VRQPSASAVASAVAATSLDALRRLGHGPLCPARRTAPLRRQDRPTTPEIRDYCRSASLIQIPQMRGAVHITELSQLAL